MNQRERAISNISALYPADSEFEKSREIGIQLLEEAKRNTTNWRNLPDETLFEYERLCIEENRKQEEQQKRASSNYCWRCGE